MRRFFFGKNVPGRSVVLESDRLRTGSGRGSGSGRGKEEGYRDSLYPSAMWVIGWVRERLFSKTVAELRGAWGRLIRFLRILWFAAREFRIDYCAERASTLSFATIISLIPL